MAFDPISKATKEEEIVMRGRKRRYHRFRAAPYYGGIITADALGCCLLCAYCWNYYRNLHPGRSGEFYSPEAVANKLLGLSQKKDWHLYRITGAEPVLGETSLNHLIDVQRLVTEGDPKGRFILETNGLMLGYNPEFVKQLNPQGLMVRVAIKGVDPESFEKITGAEKSYFEYQLRAVKLLQERGIESWPALMQDLFTSAEIELLNKRLVESDIKGELEFEYLERYPYVMNHLRSKGIQVHGPDRTKENV